ncbi:MAG: GntR family transcriptional regulator [Pseudomonadales bacterium]
MQKLTFEVRPLAEVLDANGLHGQGSLVDQVYRLLREQIVNLSLPPESALVEQEVARVLTVSKTPVREAIIRLSREGLVQVVPKSGSYVTAVSLDRYLEAFFVRTQLEVGCVRRLAERGVTLTEEVKLRALLTVQQEALERHDDRRFFELDEDLHRCFFELAGLPGAWRIMNEAKAEIDRVRHLKRLIGVRNHKLVLEEHTALVNAIVDRDPVSAEQSLLDNIGVVADEMNLIAENPQLLRTIEDLNKLVRLDRRSRGSKKMAKAG